MYVHHDISLGAYPLCVAPRRCHGHGVTVAYGERSTVGSAKGEGRGRLEGMSGVRWISGVIFLEHQSLPERNGWNCSPVPTMSVKDFKLAPGSKHLFLLGTGVPGR